jgi:peptidoglycan/LPS O-acetylase OafA/YrhL
VASAAEVNLDGSSRPGSVPLTATAQSFVASARWTSALVVMLAHLRAILFVGWESLPAQAKTMPVRAFYALTSLSHEAVIVFFVLSGFLVGGSNFDRALRGKFDLRSYSVDRFTRIYVTLVPALMLTVALDWIGMSWLGWTGFYDGTHPLVGARFHPAFEAKQGVAVFVGNLFMLQPVYVPVLGSNIPLWSLSYEVWFYVWFAAVAAAVSGFRGARIAVPLLTLILGYLFQWLALYYLVIWCLGIVAFRWPTRATGVGLPILALGVSLGLAAVKAGDVLIGGLTVSLSDFPVGVSFAWLLVRIKNRRVRWLEASLRPNLAASDFSYSLYVTHFPLVLLLSTGIASALGLWRELQSGLVPNNWRDLVVYVGTAAGACFAAFIFSLLFERRTAAARRGLKRLIASRP